MAYNTTAYSEDTKITTIIPGTSTYLRYVLGNEYHSNLNLTYSNEKPQNKVVKLCIFIFLWLSISVIYTIYWGENVNSDFPIALAVVFISSGIPLFIILYTIGVIYNVLYYYPKEKRNISNYLDIEESTCINTINSQIDSALIGLHTHQNLLWDKIQQNFIDNHARYMLEDHYMNIRKILIERQDFSMSYVQSNYDKNEDKLSALIEERPYIDFDIENYFSQSVIKAYKEFSTAWFSMTNNSELIMRYGAPIPFPRFTFGRVGVRDLQIPSFINYYGDIIYIFPTFSTILKRDFSITFIPLEKIRVNLSKQVIQFDSFHYPKDSIFVKESWEHSNKDGSRDARYTYNQRYIHCEVADIHFIGTPTRFSFQASNYGLSSVMKVNFLNLQKVISDKSNLDHFNIDSPALSGFEISDSEPTDEYTNNYNIKKSMYTFFDLDAADPLFVDAAYWILSTRLASHASIQRNFNITNERAAKILEEIEDAGIISSSTTTAFTKEIEFSTTKFNDWLNFQKSVKNEASAPSDDCKKKTPKRSKHYVGEKHPTQPWVWTEYAPGKFDWRKNRNKSTTKVSPNPRLHEDSHATKELNTLIGLAGVKNEIAKLQDFIKIQRVRQLQGLKTSPISYHCVFTGNPGTGKTTVARIVAEIYRDMGILKKGHLVETDRSGLVAEYVGQTAVKTNAVVDSALDGVLFIDEAYSLAPTSSNDFGHEAIATLLKRMEDSRDRLVVILAGYGNEMQTFIDANPGLQSRFNRYIHFDDYSAEDLLAIYELNLKKHQYKMSDSAKTILKDFLENAIANKDKNFGNGRFVRNIFEITLQNQATRLSAMNKLSKEDLQLIVDEDIPTI